MVRAEHGPTDRDDYETDHPNTYDDADGEHHRRLEGREERSGPLGSGGNEGGRSRERYEFH